MNRPVRLALATAAAAAAFGGSLTLAQTGAVALPPLVITATRAATAVDDLPVRIDRWTASDLRSSPALTLDEVLKDSAAFGLFRRTGSLTANPTAQGVSLRGLGPSGASRTLVLLDGVPLNDPFGGWVAWAAVPRGSIDSVEIVRGGGSGVWGNAALGGTVQVRSSAAPNPAGWVGLTSGTHGTRQGEVWTAVSAPGGAAVTAGARIFRTDGSWALAPSQRGPVDRRLHARHTLAHAGWRQPLGAGAGEAWAEVRAWQERRGNGTVAQRNESKLLTGRVGLKGESGVWLWDLLAYGQDQDFASTFTAVDVARASETLTLDQYAVPARAMGGAATAQSVHAGGAATGLGLDWRTVRGETREWYLPLAGVFTRERRAGGAQDFVGIYAQHEQPFGDRWRTSAALRFDGWQHRRGLSREAVPADGTVMIEERFPRRRGGEWSPAWGAVWSPRDDIRIRAAAYGAFRVPTLNELYRPFRVGPVATAANPALAVESLRGGEWGVEGTAARRWRWSVALFRQELSEAVANVTVAPNQRQRLNLDRVRVDGWEWSLRRSWGEAAEVAFDYLASDARVRTATVAPGLVGRRLAQVPRHTATARFGWRPAAGWQMAAHARWTSRQFEDDENQLPLAAAATVGGAVGWEPGAGWVVRVSGENLFDARVEAGRTAAGLVTLAPGRSVRIGVERSW